MDTAIDYASLADDAFDRVHSAVVAEYQRRLPKRRAAAKTAIARLAREHNIDLKTMEAGPSGDNEARVQTVAVKYRDPDNSANVWTGRGKRPAWVNAQLAAGKGMLDLLVPKG